MFNLNAFFMPIDHPHSRPTRTRREFLRDSCCGFGGLAFASMLQSQALRAVTVDPLAPKLRRCRRRQNR